MKIFGIETSCDETGVALVEQREERCRVIGSRVSSQVQSHRPFGGVVPEIATREHLRNLPLLVRTLMKESGTDWKEIGAVAVTAGPGLPSALLIGTSYARGLAAALGCPVYGINHLEGHLFSPFWSQGERVGFPFIGLVVSGGHTLLVESLGWGQSQKLGGTVDDAAGEAFDKVARLLGLPYPGGPQIEKLAAEGDPRAHDFPRSFPERNNYNFSFSGLKTAVRYFLEKNPGRQEDRSWMADVCASFQEAVIEVLVRKTVAAAQARRISVIAASGGVLCNCHLRESLQKECAKNGIKLCMAPPDLCTDNAVMIALVAAGKREAGMLSEMDSDFDPNLKLA